MSLKAVLQLCSKIECDPWFVSTCIFVSSFKPNRIFLILQQCMLNEKVRRLSIPECITLATQRLTKYPLLFEAIIKATKGKYH